MMNPQAATAKAINWNKVLRVTFRFALAISVLAFKLVLIALSFIIGLITTGGDNDEKKETDVGFVDSYDANYNSYSHTDSYNISKEDSSRR